MSIQNTTPHNESDAPKHFALGRAIASLLKEKRLSQSALFGICGFNQFSVSRLVSGKRVLKFDEAIPLCGVLGITPEELYDRYNGVYSHPEFCELYQVTMDAAELRRQIRSTVEGVL